MSYKNSNGAVLLKAIGTVRRRIERKRDSRSDNPIKKAFSEPEDPENAFDRILV